MPHYRLVRPLGRGATGTVWLAEHERLGRLVAIKILGDSRGSSDAVLARFELEARATAALTSPHAVRILDYGALASGHYYCVLDYIDGLDLQTLVAEHGAIPCPRAVYLAIQVCDALADAHRHGLLHRDLKPANVMVSRLPASADQATVVDFGLVRAIGCDRDAPTTPANISGTPAYLPPEVVMSECHGECTVDGRADLYALGCVLYWLVTGRTVFAARTAVDQAIAHATEAPSPPSHHSPQPIPEALEDVILRCLDKQPGRRPADADELRQLLEGTGLGALWDRDRARDWWRAVGAR